MDPRQTQTTSNMVRGCYAPRSFSARVTSSGREEGELVKLAGVSEVESLHSTYRLVDTNSLAGTLEGQYLHSQEQDNSLLLVQPKPGVVRSCSFNVATLLVCTLR